MKLFVPPLEKEAKNRTIPQVGKTLRRASVLYSRTMGNSAGGGIRRKDRKKWMKQFNCTRAASTPFMAGLQPLIDDSILLLLPHAVTEEDIEHELRRFKRMASKDGVITKAQYFEIVSSRMSAFGEDMLHAVFRSMDLDGDG